MKRIFTLTLALLLTLSLGTAALAQEKAPASITVSGTATISVTADMATLQLGANTRAKTVQEAAKENDAIMQKVIQALKDLGIPEEDLVTSQYSVYSEIPYDVASSLRTPDPIYVVTNMLIVTVRDLSKVAPAIDAATKAGANQIVQLSFEASKHREAYDKALTRAVEDAQAKARVLAEAAGKKLGELTSINATEVFGVPYGAQNRFEMLDAASKGPSIISGDVSVNANVTLVYTFE